MFKKIALLFVGLGLSAVAFSQIPPNFGQRVEELIKSRDPSVKLRKGADQSVTAIFPCGQRQCEQTFYRLPLKRENVFMNVVVLTEHQAKNKKALLVVRGGDANVEIKGLLTPNRDGLQYLYNHLDLFLDRHISLIDTGCPTDKLKSYNDCADGYRKSQQYADDFKVIIDFLKKHYEMEDFYVFGHSSGGISSRWLGVNLSSELKGIVNSSVMNLSRGTDNLSYSTVGFNMDQIKIKVLNIAHKDDACLTTPYSIVKSYAKDNLVTVLGGGSSGPLCEGTNHHSFEGRQRGVSRAIAKWMDTGVVQATVDNDD
jgi:hypothetical protein